MTYYEFTGGKPPPESFPVQELMASAQRVLEQEGRDLVFYPGQHAHAGYSNKGYLGLREVASSRFAHREGVPLPVENIAITAGSMQAIELIGRHFIKPGDTVITSELCYVGTLRFLRYLGARIVGVPVDYLEGMDMEALETTLSQLAAQSITPKFVYITDSHQNPTGAIVSASRRKRLLELGAQYDVLIVEDDCYGDLDFESGIIPPAMYTMDTEENVIFVASFSKILGPGLRLGCFCAPDKYLDDILAHRWDAGTSTLSCMIVADFLQRHMWPHIAKHVAIIKEKRDTLLQTLEKHLDGVATWTKPRGGLFDWVTLPNTIDLSKLAALAEERGIVYSPGQVFHWNNDVIKHLRLSYTHMSLEDIRNGVAILARCIKEAS
jgi:2-aminoadipate transaminase